ncbi:MAG: hydroxymethylglutaryl-CoA lyase [Actinomycetota bacterium]
MIAIREVGPRDGLQVERPLPPGTRALLVISLTDAGLSQIEVGSFVSPRAVPAMAGADQVFALLPRGGPVTFWALVPNRRGAELAHAVGVTAITITVSASAEYSRKNIRAEVEESIKALPDIAAAAPGARLDVVISCAFGSPYGDVTSVTDVESVVAKIRGEVSAELTLADTTGAATPRRIRSVLEAVGNDVGLHLHDTRGTAVANALASIELGVRRFDTSIGGLGGSPFAEGAGGNLATEDLVSVLEDMGMSTGVDFDRLLAVSRGLEVLIGRKAPGRTAAAGRLPAFD